MPNSPNPLGSIGFEPRTTPAERRAFFDLLRRLNSLRIAVTGIWDYETSTAAPPNSGGIRTDGAGTTLWLHQIDGDGYYRLYELAAVDRGDRIVLRGTNGSRAQYIVDKVIENGTYYTYEVTQVDAVGTVNPNAPVLVDLLIRPGQNIKVAEEAALLIGTFFDPPPPGP